MICTEVANMRVSEFLRKVIVPVGTAIFLAALFYPLCVENGVCDYLKLWILIGIPFGVHRMFVWVIPKGFDIGGTVGVLVMNLLICGVIGGIILSAVGSVGLLSGSVRGNGDFQTNQKMYGKIVRAIGKGSEVRQSE